MSTLTQFFGGQGAGVPVGSYVDMTDQTPNVYTVGEQVYLRQGVVATSTTYPDVPASLVGNIYNTEVKQSGKYPTPYTNYLSRGHGSAPVTFKMAQNGLNIIGFPAGWNFSGAQTNDTNNTVYAKSTDGGVQYEYIIAPWVNDTTDIYAGGAYGCAGLFYFNAAFICVLRNGTVYRQTDNGTTWTISAVISYSIGKVKEVNNRLFILPGDDGPLSNTGVLTNLNNYRTLQGVSSDIMQWSSDGITWQTVNVGVASKWCDITHNGSVYVILDRTAQIRKCTSATDPTSTWQYGTNNLTSSIPGLNANPCVATSLGQTLVVANGYNQSAQSDGYSTFQHRSRLLWYSTNNGDTWTQVTLQYPWSNGTEVGAAAGLQNLQTQFLFDGTNLWYLCGKIYKSTNGTSWTEHTATTTVDRYNHIYGSLTFSNSAWHGISDSSLQGTGGTGAFNLISFYNYTSTANLFTTATIVEQVEDGLQIETRLDKDANTIILFPGNPDGNSGVPQTLRSVSDLSCGGNRYTISSADSSTGWVQNSVNGGLFRKYMYSTDAGATWQYGNLPFIAAWQIPGIGQGGDIYIYANGQSAGSTTLHYPSTSTLTEDRRIYKTQNLTTWSTPSSAFTANNQGQVLKFFQNADRTSTSFISFGGSGDTAYKVYTSTDSGSTWVQVYSGTFGTAATGNAYGNRITPIFHSQLGGTYFAYTTNSGNSTGTREAYIVWSPSNFSSGTVYTISLLKNELHANYTDASNYQTNIVSSVVVTNSGKIIVQWQEAHNGTGTPNSGPRCHISISTDRGTTWDVKQLGSIDSSYTETASLATVTPVYVAYDKVDNSLFVRYKNKIAISMDEGVQYSVQNVSRTITSFTPGQAGYVASNTAYGAHKAINFYKNYGVTLQYQKMYNISNFHYAPTLTGNYIRNNNYISPTTGVVKYMRVK